MIYKTNDINTPTNDILSLFCVTTMGGRRLKNKIFFVDIRVQYDYRLLYSEIRELILV